MTAWRILATVDALSVLHDYRAASVHTPDAWRRAKEAAEAAALKRVRGADRERRALILASDVLDAFEAEGIGNGGFLDGRAQLTGAVAYAQEAQRRLAL